MLVIHIHVFVFSISSFESEKQYHIHPEWNKTNVVPCGLSNQQWRKSIRCEAREGALHAADVSQI